ncbi:fluoride efflux transporter CrcB [Tautonia sociabilis]|uniref:Fluoride-specific ion channel FluC n=1 Tax=Tautonia sociabilis TaxID=2080755 RepID=A0A432MBU8_9BACT|nr:fluoride efflux transporter CrcB [Tautonia sociabilis]
MKVLLLALGGALGANARYWLGLWVAGWAGTRFPWATLLINVSGSFLLGFLASAFDRWRPSPSPSSEALTLLVLVGLLGGYTTFSTFALESLRLWHEPSWIRSLGYLTLSATAGLLAASLGVASARLLSDTLS